MLFSQKLGPLAGPSFCNHLQLQAKQPITAVTSQLPVEIPSEIRLKNMPKRGRTHTCMLFLGKYRSKNAHSRSHYPAAWGLIWNKLWSIGLPTSASIWLTSALSNEWITCDACSKCSTNSWRPEPERSLSFTLRNSTLNHKYTNFYFNGHLAKTSNTVLEVQLLKHMSLKSI
jgi:hypothetical protein